MSASTAQSSIVLMFSQSAKTYMFLHYLLKTSCFMCHLAIGVTASSHSLSLRPRFTLPMILTSCSKGIFASSARLPAWTNAHNHACNISMVSPKTPQNAIFDGPKSTTASQLDKTGGKEIHHHPGIKQDYPAHAKVSKDPQPAASIRESPRYRGTHPLLA